MLLNLALNLRGIVAQRLVLGKDGQQGGTDMNADFNASK